MPGNAKKGRERKLEEDDLNNNNNKNNYNYKNNNIKLQLNKKTRFDVVNPNKQALLETV